MQDVLQLSNEARRELLNREAAFARRALELYAPAQESLNERLKAVEARLLKAEQAGVDPRETFWWGERARLEAAIADMAKEMDRLSIRLLDEASQRVIEEANIAAETHADIVKVGGGFGRLPVGALEELTRRMERQPLSKLFGGVAESVTKEARQKITNAIAAGDGPRSLVRGLSELLDSTKWEAERIARTEVVSAHRDAALWTYRANSDRVTGYRRLAAKNARTCPLCLALDGRTFPLDTPFWTHPCCRCTSIPFIEGVTDDAMSDRETGDEWFARQDRGSQVAILGPAKQRLYAGGHISLQDLVGERVDPQFGRTGYVRSIKQLVNNGVVDRETAIRAIKGQPAA